MLDTSLRVDAERLTLAVQKTIDQLNETCVALAKELKEANDNVRQQEKTDARENADLQLARERQATANHAYTMASKNLVALKRCIEGYTPTGVINLGTTVDLRLLSVNGATPNFPITSFIIKIVEHDAGDAQNSFVARDCAVGKAIMGRVAGDVVAVTTPTGILKYKIERVY